MRVVQRLPGAAASGASAKTHFRGGEEGEIGIMLNGQQLFDPYHIRDYQSIFSAIDARAIEGVEVYTGGFPVRFGDRMSGLVIMESLESLQPRHTEIGLSVFNSSFLTAGRTADRNWLVSARRGNLDLVINSEFGRPSYFDIFGEFAIDISPNATLSINGLLAEDSVELILESEPAELERVTSNTRNGQLWVQLDNRWSEDLTSKLVLSAISFNNTRKGSLGDEEKLVGAVFDDRDVEQFSVRQDWTWNSTKSHLTQWGIEVMYAFDARAIEGVEVYTGGFPVRFGDRMSGLVIMESLESLQPRHTEIGLSVFNSSFLTAGRTADRNWLVSARRGNLDLALFTATRSCGTLHHRVSFSTGARSRTCPILARTRCESCNDCRARPQVAHRPKRTFVAVKRGRSASC